MQLFIAYKIFSLHMSIDVYFGMANSKKHVLACGKKLSGASFMYGRGFKILNGIMNPEIDAGNRFLAYSLAAIGILKLNW